MFNNPSYRRAGLIHFPLEVRPGDALFGRIIPVVLETIYNYFYQFGVGDFSIEIDDSELRKIVIAEFVVERLLKFLVAELVNRVEIKLLTMCARR